MESDELKQYKLKVGRLFIECQDDIADHTYDHLFEELGLLEYIDDF